MTPSTTSRVTGINALPRRGLMDCPPEIRKQIFEYIAVDADPIEVTTFKVLVRDEVKSYNRVRQPAERWRLYTWHVIRKPAVHWLVSSTSKSEFALVFIFNRQVTREVQPLGWSFRGSCGRRSLRLSAFLDGCDSDVSLYAGPVSRLASSFLGLGNAIARADDRLPLTGRG